MATKTQNLELVELQTADLAAAAAVNESYWKLDTVVQLAVLSATVTAAPADARQGDRYIVPDDVTPADVWDGHARQVAYLASTGWLFRAPRTGWEAYVLETDVVMRFVGAQWAALPRVRTLLSDLDDVDVDEDTITEGQILAWSAASSKFNAVDPPTGGGGGSIVGPDTPPGTADPMDDEFDAGVSVDTGKWSWRNQGSATAPVGQGALQLKAPAASGDNLHIVEQTLPAGSWRFRAKLVTNEVANFAAGGMVLVNTGNAKCFVLGTGHNSGSGGDITLAYKYTNTTTFSSAAATDNSGNYGGIWQFRYFEIEYDTTNLIFRVSSAGVDGTFFQLFSEAVGTFLGVPDKVGLFVSPNNAGNGLQTTVAWFRRMA